LRRAFTLVGSKRKQVATAKPADSFQCSKHFFFANIHFTFQTDFFGLSKTQRRQCWTFECFFLSSELKSEEIFFLAQNPFRNMRVKFLFPFLNLRILLRWNSKLTWFFSFEVFLRELFWLFCITYMCSVCSQTTKLNKFQISIRRALIPF
jgi:hypothetical protein